jgi:hypothetical protein
LPARRSLTSYSLRSGAGLRPGVVSVRASVSGDNSNAPRSRGSVRVQPEEQRSRGSRDTRRSKWFPCRLSRC